jgi:uncharacterized protein (DUF1015 family)
MAIIAPFEGLFYNVRRLGDLSSLVAPPYDVISEEQQETYYQKSPYNVIRLILGKKKTGDSDWDNRYTRAADHFNRWQFEGALIAAARPCMFITSLTYDPGDGGGQRTRWGLIALVRIEEDDSGVILPHERTFSAHKDDRLKLTRACNAQFSQIFALYEDSPNSVFEALKEITQGPPKTDFDLEDGTAHRLWVVQDRSIFERLADLMSDKTFFIADGHHRYETARNFRNIMRARYGRRSPNRPYEYVMMYLSNMDDEGLTILPSHRLVKRSAEFRVEPFLERLKGWFEITTLSFPESGPASGWAGLKKGLDEKGRVTSAIGFYHHGGDRFYILSLKPGVRDEMGDDLHPSLKKLDVLVLSRLVLQNALGFSREDLDDEEIFQYHSDMKQAISMVDSGMVQMAFLLNPTRMEHVKEVAGSKLIMPRKSTYFYPKVLTGLVFNKIDPHAFIEIF